MTRSTAQRSLVVIIVLISISIAGVIVLQMPSQTDTNDPLTEIRIACYNGEGVMPEEEIILSNFSVWLGCEITFIGGDDIQNDALDNYDVLILPGGNGYVYWNEIGVVGKTKIQNFVNEGGGYLGICEGAYRACEYAVWMDDPSNPAPDYLILGPESFLGIFPGVAWGPVFEIAERPDPGWGMAAIDIVNNTHPTTISATERMTMYYQGGCYIVPQDNSSITILGLYNATGQPAIAACEYGQGRVFITGPHPELEEDDDRDGVEFHEPVSGPYDPESDWPLLRDTVKWLCKIDTDQTDPVNSLSIYGFELIAMTKLK